jgi:hypothetical protein
VRRPRASSTRMDLQAVWVEVGPPHARPAAVGPSEHPAPHSAERLPVTCPVSTYANQIVSTGEGLRGRTRRS